MHTLGSLQAEIYEWLDETIEPRRVNTAINDAIESLWESLVIANVDMFVVGPIGVSLTANTEGVILVSIPDPAVPPSVSDVPASDSALPSHTVRVAYTLVTESGSETLTSPITTHICGLGKIASVERPERVEGATGWNVYASSSSEGDLVLQTQEPLNWDSDYTEPESGFSDDPNGPFAPFENTTGDDIAYIQHLELQMPDGGWKRLDSADLSSLLMRRAARSLATASQYQTYYWVLINQRQLEIRPATTLPLVPRYFYVKRPRRLAFPNSALPFLTIPSVAFLRNYAMSKLSISIREFDTAKAYALTAEDERVKLQLAVLQMNRPKNEFITPYP